MLLSSLRVGDVEVRDVEAIIVPAAMSHVPLGNSFLNRFQMKRENDVMTLELRCRAALGLTPYHSAPGFPGGAP